MSLKDILKNFPLNEPIQDISHLFPNLNNSDQITIQLHPIYKTRCFFAGKQVLSINTFDHSRQVRMTARMEITSQIIGFLIDSGDHCELCDKTINGKKHIDHITPFIELFEAFMVKEELTYDSIFVIKTQWSRKFHWELSLRWQWYHFRNAKLRPVHPECNLSRSF
jgi:hypothetical protein